jgi:RNA polymerase sigma-70 factor (ECF subfamily)
VTEGDLRTDQTAGEASAAEIRLVEALRRGDEAVFVELVHRYGTLMRRVASFYVKDAAVIDEVVQETWLGVVTGIERFEGRSSFKTWLFRVLANVARNRAVRESRSVPFSALGGAEIDDDEPSVEADRFLPSTDRWAGHWASSPRRFEDVPEARLVSDETMRITRTAIDLLPEAQRVVITMRDVVGFTSEEVCEALELSDGNQRVLLHRARTQVRKALERYFKEGD